MKRKDKRQAEELVALAAMPEEEIDFSDIAEVKDWSRALVGKFYRPIKKSLTTRLDADVLAWLRSQGRGYQTRINKLLRAAMAGEQQRDKAPRARPSMEEDLLLPLERTRLRGDYRKFFMFKRNNYFGSIQRFGRLWDCFLALDEIWMREISDANRITHTRQVLPLILFLNAHGQFRSAFELGFSSRLGDAWNMIRSAIESCVHACKVYRDPSLALVWAHKDDGKKEFGAYRAAFEHNKRESLFPDEYGLSKLHQYYSQYSDWGTHSTIAALSLRYSIERREDEVNWMLQYLETDHRRLATSLYHILGASSEMEKAFFDCFHDRLNLDIELVKMRDDFEHRKKITADEIVRRYEIESPPVVT